MFLANQFAAIRRELGLQPPRQAASINCFVILEAGDIKREADILDSIPSKGESC